nr:SNF2-related protein [Staphylococcus aureus]
MNINFSDSNTKGVSERLYQRFLESNNKYQTLTLFTGFGKTAISIATAGLFANEKKKDINIFIIAPKRKLEEKSWEETVKAYNHQSVYKLNIMAQVTPQGLLVADKNDKLRKKDIKAMRPSRQAQLQFLKKWTAEIEETETIVLIDEVQNFKNPTAKTSKALVKLIENAISIGLSATPMPNGILEDGVAYLVYNGFYKNQSDFRKQHIPPMMYDKYYRPDVYTKERKIDPNRFLDLDTFYNRIKETTFVPDIAVDFDMPNQQVHTISYDLEQATIELIQKQAKDYKERRYDSYMEYLADIKKSISRDISHVDKMKYIVKENADKQPLIFYETNAQLEAILRGLEEIGQPYKMLNGRPDSDSIDDIDRDNPNQAIVIQYKSGGTGIEFKASRATIFFGLVYSWQDIQQAMGRNLRRGMAKDVYVNQWFLVATHAHDAKIYDVIERKEEFSEELLKKLAEDITSDVLK